MPPSHTAGGDRRAFLKRSEAARLLRNQHIIDRGAWKDSSDLRARVRFTRQIFRAMDCNIDTSGKKRPLNFCREQSFSSAARVFNWRARPLISFRRDDFGFDLQVRPGSLNSCFNQMGLRARQLAAARAMDDL